MWTWENGIHYTEEILERSVETKYVAVLTNTSKYIPTTSEL